MAGTVDQTQSCYITRLPTELLISIFELLPSLAAVESLAWTCVHLHDVYIGGMTSIWQSQKRRMIEPMIRLHKAVTEGQELYEPFGHPRIKRIWKMISDKNPMAMAVIEDMPYFGLRVGRHWRWLDWKAYRPGRKAHNGVFTKVGKSQASLKEHGIDERDCIALATRYGQRYWILDTKNSTIWDDEQCYDAVEFFEDKREAFRQYYDAINGVASLDWLYLEDDKRKELASILEQYGWPETAWHEGYADLKQWIWQAYPEYRCYWPRPLDFPRLLCKSGLRRVMCRERAWSPQAAAEVREYYRQFESFYIWRSEAR